MSLFWRHLSVSVCVCVFVSVGQVDLWVSNVTTSSTNPTKFAPDRRYKHKELKAMERTFLSGLCDGVRLRRRETGWTQYK